MWLQRQGQKPDPVCRRPEFFGSLFQQPSREPETERQGTSWKIQFFPMKQGAEETLARKFPKLLAVETQPFCPGSLWLFTPQQLVSIAHSFFWLAVGGSRCYQDDPGGVSTVART